MADILDSLLITLDDAEDSSDVDITFAYDDTLNTYGDNDEAVTTFYADESIYLLAQLPTGYSIARIQSSSGSVVNLGMVTRTEEVEDMTFEDLEEKSLTWYPSSTPDVTELHEGISPVLVVEDNTIKSNTAPVVIDFNYDYRAYSLRVDHPRDMDIEDDETFPLLITIEVTV